MSVSACQRAYSIRTHTNTGTVCAKSVCGKWEPVTHESLINSDYNNGLSRTGVNNLM